MHPTHYTIPHHTTPSLPQTCSALTLLRPRTRMRFVFPQYLFPAFLFRHHQLEQESQSPNSKNKSKSDDAVQAAGETSFTYLVCKGCHTPCTALIQET